MQMRLRRTQVVVLIPHNVNVEKFIGKMRFLADFNVNYNTNSKFIQFSSRKKIITIHFRNSIATTNRMYMFENI